MPIKRDATVKDIYELAADMNEQELFMMPDVRIIGKAYRCTFEADMAGQSPHQKYWGEFLAFRSVIDTLPCIIKGSMVCWTGDCPKGSNYYTYMPGVICPAGTPVPEGLDYRDLPASVVAKGAYGNEVDDVISKFRPLGYSTCYTDLGWDAKLFLDEDEISQHLNSPCRWLVPCSKA